MPDDGIPRHDDFEYPVVHPLGEERVHFALSCTVVRCRKPHFGQVMMESRAISVIFAHLWTIDGYPASVVALVSAAGVVRSGSKMTVAVLI